MASQVQRRLDMNFPVRKNTRLRSKAAANENKTDSQLSSSPRKRNGKAVPDENIPMSCSPTKKKKDSARVTRSRTRETPSKTSLISKFSKDKKTDTKSDDISKNVIPLTSPKKLDKEEIVPRLPSHHGDLSPLRVKPIFTSPVKSNKPSLLSPLKASDFEKLALTSPKFNHKSDSGACQLLVSPSKHVRFAKSSFSSPVKDSRLPLSPSKLFNQNDASPVKAKKSPIRPTDSPSKRQLFAPTTSDSSVLCSPSKLLRREGVASPMKNVRRFGIISSPSKSKPSILNSPSKSRFDILRSPSKSRPDILRSPSKSRPDILRSPSKSRPDILRSPSKSKPCILSSPSKCRPDFLSSLSKHCPDKENSLMKPLRTPVGKSAAMLRLQKVESPAYHLAKQSLHTAKPERLDCRDREVGAITEFLERHLKATSAGSLYISGAPGTGKTASLLHIIDDLKKQHHCKIGYLNCMMLKDSTTVFRKLHEELTGRKMPGNRDTMKYMEKCVTTAKQSIILVLDEIDQLDSKNQEVLYTIFEWPSLAHSKLILVGIANALDLTDRILPRLQARPNCRPQLLNFAPYTKDQIASIIRGRLTKLEEDGLAVIEPSAIQFCARKVSAVAGDMRKALDVCRRAVEMVEHEIRSQPVLAAGCTSPRKSQLPVPKKITVMHISRILSDVYGSSVKSSSQEETVPLQQKLVVCTLLLMLKESRFKEVSLGKLHETYCKVCTKRQVAKIDQSEFFALCFLLETRGILGIKKAKESRLAKVTLKQDEKELEHTLHDRVLMSSILKDGIPK